MSEKKEKEKTAREAKPEEREIVRLKAPDSVKGTDWRERFYNEIVPVRGRVAEVRRPGNVKELLRRGWTPADAEVAEEDNAKKTQELEEKAKLFIENFATIIEEAKGLPESEELTSAIEDSEEALEEAASERDMSIARIALVAIMDKIKEDAPAAEGVTEEDDPAEEEATEEVDPPPSEVPETEKPKEGEEGAAAPEEEKKGFLGNLKDKLTGKDKDKPGAEGDEAPGEDKPPVEGGEPDKPESEEVPPAEKENDKE